MARMMPRIVIDNQDELTKELEEASEALGKLVRMGIILPEELPSRETMAVRLGDYYLKNVKMEIKA